MIDKSWQALISPIVLGVICELKRSGGSTLKELAETFQLTPNGVRQHILSLEQQEFVSWHKIALNKKGRPEKFCKLTSKADALFIQNVSPVSLDILNIANTIYGSLGTEKILRQYFLELEKNWLQYSINLPSLTEKIDYLISQRQQLGYADFHYHDSDHGDIIFEYHNPFQSLYSNYTFLKQIEYQMIAKVLDKKVSQHLAEPKFIKATAIPLYQIHH